MISPHKALLASIFALALTACGTPQAVKSLSAEQVKAMDAFSADLKAYFGVVEQLVGNQIKQANDQLDQLSDDILALERRKVAAELQKSGKVDAQSPALVAFTGDVKTQLAFANQLKGELADRKASLESADSRFLTAFSTLVEAQKKLDQFLQLERADERLLNELLGAVGVTRAQFDQAIDTVTTATKGVNDTMTKINELKKAS